MQKLKNKVAIITGGASGIGLAISQRFAKEGCQVHIFDIDPDLAEREADLIVAAGGHAIWHAVNVADQTAVKAEVDKISKKWPIHILVNNAGVAHIGTAESTSEADFDRVFNVNVKGMYNMLHTTLPYLKIQGGVVINMASVAATVAVSERFAYSASKGAVYAMTLSVAKDYLKFGIRCNSISPARIHTPFVDGFVAKNYPDRQTEIMETLAKSQPIGRMGQPFEVAAMALYLASDEAAFLTGIDYKIDGGFTTLNA